MHIVHNHLQGMADGSRLMYRSAHIYLLWAALVNIALGSSSFANVRSNFPRIQTVVAITIALVPVLVCYSFFTESTESSFHRSFMRSAIILAFLGVIIHAALGYYSQRLSAKSNLKQTALTDEIVEIVFVTQQDERWR